MKNITTNTARKIAAAYTAHKGHFVADFPAFSSIIIASAIGLAIIGVFTQIDAGNPTDAWGVYF